MSACAHLMHILFIGNFCEQPAQLLAPRIEYIRSTRHPCSVFGAWPSPLRLSDHCIFEGASGPSQASRCMRSITPSRGNGRIAWPMDEQGVVVECVFGRLAALDASVSVPVKGFMRASAGVRVPKGLT